MRNKSIIIGLIAIFNITILTVNNSVRNTAAEISYQVVRRVKQMHPQFKTANPIVYIYGDLDNYRGIPVYLFGINKAFSLFYPDKPPSAYIIRQGFCHSHEVTGDFDLRNCYTENSYLMYWDAQRKDLKDITDNFKLELKNNFEKIEPTMYPRWNSNEFLTSWIIDSLAQKTRFSSPTLNIPIVGVKAIEIKMRIRNEYVSTGEGEISWFIGKDKTGYNSSRIIFFKPVADKEFQTYTFAVKMTEIEQIEAILKGLVLALPYPKNAVEIEHIQIIPFEQVSEMAFSIWDFRRDFNLWDAGGGGQVKITERPMLLVWHTNGSPAIVSPHLDIPIREIKSVKLKMRIVPKGEPYPQRGKLFWITDTDENWEKQRKCLLFDIIPDEKFHTYEIPFGSVNSEQDKAKLIQLRLCLVSFPAEVEVERIELVSK